MKRITTRLGLLAALVVPVQPVLADIPAVPVMTLYKFNGALDVPYYDVDDFLAKGPEAKPAGTLAQGTSLVPCLVIRNGEPVTDKNGTPYVGFDVVVDSRKATRDSTDRFNKTVAVQKAKRVSNHHCGAGVRHVISVRTMYALEKAPFFDPPALSGKGSPGGGSELDRIVRDFHNSPHCAKANATLIGRRGALEKAWDAFMAKSKGDPQTLARAKHLDYVMRTTLYEGHLERGCNAYGACERNVIALSVRNRARGQCVARQGCGFPGDFQGAASAPSQYNIWDEYLTQISGLTACYLRDDLAEDDYYRKIRSMYEQSVGDVETILYGSDAELAGIFPGTDMNGVLSLRHYYHAPAMGKCFPGEPRVEYMSGAVASKGNDFALIANTRIRVDSKAGNGYHFREFRFDEAPDRDLTRIEDNYPGFVVDGRKVSLKSPSSCPPYGIPSGCSFKDVGRYRRTPSWLKAGRPLELGCRIEDRGPQCLDAPTPTRVSVGGTCDTEMRPVAGVK